MPEQPDKDFLIVALDLLSELTEALRDYIDPLVEQSNLIQLVYICAQVTLLWNLEIINKKIKYCFKFIFLNKFEFSVFININ